MENENEMTSIAISKKLLSSLRVLGRSGDSAENIISMLYNFYLKENEYICRECGSGMEEHDKGMFVCIACGHTYNTNSKVKK